MPQQFFWDNSYMNRHIPGPIRSFHYSYPRPIRKNKKSTETLQPEIKAPLGSAYQGMIRIAKPKPIPKRLQRMISAIMYWLPMSHFKYRNFLDRESHPFLQKSLHLKNKKAPIKRATGEEGTLWASFFQRMLRKRIKDEGAAASIKEEKLSEMAMLNEKSDKLSSLLEHDDKETSTIDEYLDFNNIKKSNAFLNSQNSA